MVRTLAVFAGLAATALNTLSAQAPAGSAVLSEGAAAESLAIIRALTDTVRRTRSDAAAWHRRGMIAWTLYERTRHAPPIKSLDWTLLLPLADSSLRLAVDYEPHNPQYYLALGRFLLSASVTYRHYGPYRSFDAALEMARASGDPEVHAQAALANGRRFFIRVATSAGVTACRASAGDGVTDWLRAEAMFHEAYDAAPGYAPAFWQLAALFAHKRRWIELSALSRRQIESDSTHGWAWMTLALATHRRGEIAFPRIAFERGLAFLPAQERQRLDRIERVLGPAQRASYERRDPSRRVEMEQAYWRLEDPLWSIEGNEPRVEFLARVAFAELRWTADELGFRGAETLDGQLHVRTGSVEDLACKSPRVVPKWLDAMTILQGNPVDWRRTAGVRLDTMPTQGARFRAPHDSIDFVVGTLAPVSAIRRATDVAGPVRTDFWLVAGGTVDVWRDSVVPSPESVQVFTRRLPPGLYVYRMESTADGSRVAGRAMGAFVAGDDLGSGFAGTGYGMSDILVATRAVPRDIAARRWSDLDFAPLVGNASKGSEISVVWELYDLVPKDGSASYAVSIAVRRPPTRSSAGAVSASLAGNIANAIGVRARDQVEFRFNRTVPHADALVDHVALSLGDTPPGIYVLTITVTDLNTGYPLTRSQRLRIQEAK